MEHVAAVAGVHEQSVAVSCTHNRWANDKGCRNTNKPGDLKVIGQNIVGVNINHS